MINLYINYPNKKFTVHSNPACGNIRSHEKDNQRIINLNHQSATKELMRFLDNEHKFASEKEFNDMWVIIDFGDPKLELAVVDHLWLLSTKTYSHFRGITPEIHCESA